MLILFDNGTPRGVAQFLVEHTVEEARSSGWETLSNGELIDAADQDGTLEMSSGHLRNRETLQ